MATGPDWTEATSNYIQDKLKEIAYVQSEPEAKFF